jgi:hypothetical protein
MTNMPRHHFFVGRTDMRLRKRWRRYEGLQGRVGLCTERLRLHCSLIFVEVVSYSFLTVHR